MSIQGKITSLYTDKTMSEALLPRTNTKAITDDKGVNLNAILDQVAYVDTENSEAAVAPLNADTLAGFPADNYASKTYVSNEIAKAQLGGGNGEEDIDLSGYATKDDIAVLATKEELNTIDFPVDSVNGKAGDVQLTASDVGARSSDWLPTLANLGITATATELNKLDGVTATTTELNYVDGVTSAIQTQLNGKQATISGGASTIASSNLTASRALISNSSGKVAVSAVTSTELGYLDGVTSAIQTQLDAKLPKAGGTMTGALTTTALTISGKSPTITFNETDGKNSSHIVNGNRHYLRSIASDTTYYEQFRTPVPSTGLTGNKSYDFLTTKTVTDYVVTQGTSGIWYYRKWNSGKVECWGIYSFAKNYIGESPGPFYYKVTLTFPFQMTPVTIIPTASHITLGGASLSDIGATNSTCEFFVWSTHKQITSATTSYLQVYIIGTLK